jgi:hypothetical protein
MKRFMIFAAMVAMVATAAMAQTVDDIAERAYDLLQAKNYDAAFPLMKQAAEKGDCISMGNLGTMYYKGLGTEIDYNQALRWWGEAEKKGCGDAIKAYRDELMATKSFEVDGIRYIVKADFTLMVTENYENKNIKTAQIPETVNYKDKIYSVTSIGDGAFYNCEMLETVTIPNSVTSIGSKAFMFCKGLTSVTIPNSVTTIGFKAFMYCEGLASVTIPNSVTSIGDKAFSGCSDLTSVTIPNSVTSIPTRAFEGCWGLTSVTIPNSVTSIGDKAFSGCNGLASITIGNSVISIGYRAFGGCTSLTSVTIPNSVNTIGEYAFSDCTGLTSVTLGSSVASIGDLAFHLDTNINEITCKVDDPSKIFLGYRLLDDVSNIKLRVPKASVDLYRKANGWNLFKKIVKE